jgi:hypothetical protein
VDNHDALPNPASKCAHLALIHGNLDEIIPTAFALESYRGFSGEPNVWPKLKQGMTHNEFNLAEALEVPMFFAMVLDWPCTPDLKMEFGTAAERISNQWPAQLPDHYAMGHYGLRMPPIGMIWMTQMTQDIKKALDAIPVFRNELRTNVKFKLNYGFLNLYDGFNNPKKYTDPPSRFESKKQNVDNIELDFRFDGERWRPEGTQDYISFPHMLWIIREMCPTDEANQLMKKMCLAELPAGTTDLFGFVQLKKSDGVEVTKKGRESYLNSLTKHKRNVMRSLIALYFSCT